MTRIMEVEIWNENNPIREILVKSLEEGTIANDTTVEEILNTMIPPISASILDIVKNAMIKSEMKGSNNLLNHIRIAEAIEEAEAKGTLALEDEQYNYIVEIMDKESPIRWAYFKPLREQWIKFMNLPEKKVSDLVKNMGENDDGTDND